VPGQLHTARRYSLHSVTSQTSTPVPKTSGHDACGLWGVCQTNGTGHTQLPRSEQAAHTSVCLSVSLTLYLSVGANYANPIQVVVQPVLANKQSREMR